MDFHEIQYWQGILRIFQRHILCEQLIFSYYQLYTNNQPGTTPCITRSAYKRKQQQKHAKQGTYIKWNMSQGHAKEDHFHCDQENNIIFKTPTTTEAFNIVTCRPIVK
jgi:hypothetical protein